MPENRRKKRPPPFSLRLTEEKRAHLEKNAGHTPLGEFIKSRLFADAPGIERKRKTLSLDKKLLAAVLAKLGQSRLGNNLNQLARDANSGSLP